MNRLCPCCGLPTAPEMVGAAIAATSNDRKRHGTFALCKRCIRDNRSLPGKIVLGRMARAGDHALANPDRYLCTLYPDLATARLAVAMAGHPQHAQQAITALGWASTQP